MAKVLLSGLFTAVLALAAILSQLYPEQAKFIFEYIGAGINMNPDGAMFLILKTGVWAGGLFFAGFFLHKWLAARRSPEREDARRKIIAAQLDIKNWADAIFQGLIVDLEQILDWRDHGDDPNRNRPAKNLIDNLDTEWRFGLNKPMNLIANGYQHYQSQRQRSTVSPPQRNGGEIVEIRREMMDAMNTVMTGCNQIITKLRR